MPVYGQGSTGWCREAVLQDPGTPPWVHTTWVHTMLTPGYPAAQCPSVSPSGCRQPSFTAGTLAEQPPSPPSCFLDHPQDHLLDHLLGHLWTTFWDTSGPPSGTPLDHLLRHLWDYPGKPGGLLDHLGTTPGSLGASWDHLGPPWEAWEPPGSTPGSLESGPEGRNRTKGAGIGPRRTESGQRSRNRAQKDGIGLKE